MRKLLTLLLFTFFSISFIYSQDNLNTNAFVGSAGFGSTTFGTSVTPNGNAQATYVYIGTPIAAGNAYFRFFNDQNGAVCGQYGPVSTSSDQLLSFGAKTGLVQCGSASKAFFLMQ